MADYYVKRSVELDDGAAPYFWRNGERYIRTNGQEMKLADIAPGQEAFYMQQLLSGSWNSDTLDLEAHRKSQEKGGADA